MKELKFSKGIKIPIPPHSEIKPIETIETPPKVILPLKQHKGIECVSLVKKGKEVKKGDIIGENSLIALHSPVNGKVVEIKKSFRVLDRKKTRAAVIETSAEGSQNLSNSLNSSSLLEIILKGGIVDYSSHIPPPLLEKIENAQKRKPNTFIINGLEEFFVFGTRSSLLKEKFHYVQEGIFAIKKIFSFEKTFLLIYKPILKFLDKKVLSKDLEIIPVKPKHPVHRGNIIVLSLLKKALPPNSSLERAGCFMLDIETLFSLGKALKEKTPNIEKVITISSTDLRQLKSLIVPLGTPISWILTQLGFKVDEVGKIIVNGPISGIAIDDLDYPVTKEINQIFILNQQEIFEYTSRVCIKCGLCVEVCPMNLLPFMIAGYSESGSLELAQKNNIFSCIECGTCTFVCPIRIPLLQWIQTGKHEIIKKSQGAHYECF